MFKTEYCKSWWRHQMETFFALLALCAGNSLVTGEFPSQCPVTRSFNVFFICAWINGWANNREARDLRRYRVHYDVIVMIWWLDHEIWNSLFFWLLVIFHKPLLMAGMGGWVVVVVVGGWVVVVVVGGWWLWWWWVGGAGGVVCGVVMVGGRFFLQPTFCKWPWRAI